ncbi:hypothetical protein [Chryseobacterium sp. JK1]
MKKAEFTREKRSQKDYILAFKLSIVSEMHQAERRHAVYHSLLAFVYLKF